jgi:predicted nucleotidyltransferase
MLAILLGSKLRAKVLGWLFSHPDERYFVRQLTALLKEDSTNISRELARLEKMGILVSTQVGRQKHYQANKKCAIFEELHGLAVKTAGLADVLRSALAPLADQIASAFIYGSMASGEAISASDIDLLVVGNIDEMVLHRALSGAESRLGRPVNYTLMSQPEFYKRQGEKDGFLARVLSGPKIMIMGSIDGI